MKKITQIERLKVLYNLLRERTLSKDEIRTQLDDSVSLRQIERDLIDLEKSYLRNNEKLVVKTDRKRKYYAITTKKNKKKVLTMDHFAVLNFLMVSDNPALFENFKNETKLYRDLRKALFEVYGKNQNFTEKDIVKKTGFYGLAKDNNFIKNIITVYKAIYDEKTVFIKMVKFDATSENPELQMNNFELKPLKIFYHRGDFFLAAIKGKHIKFFEIGQLEEIKILPKGFNWKSEEVKLNDVMRNRFGVTNNIDSKSYDIILEFSETTGAFVSKYKWHDNQKFEKLKNKNYRMSFTSGINRELVGWIFQWMNNVKIIEPEILKELYFKIYDDIKKTSSSNKLESKNFFH